MLGEYHSQWVQDAHGTGDALSKQSDAATLRGITKVERLDTEMN